MTLTEGWSLFFPDEPDGVYMGSRGVEMLIGRPAQVIDPETGAAADAPDDLSSWLTAHPDLNASNATPVEIAGVASTYVDLSPTTDVDVLYGGGRGNNFHIPAINVRFYVIPQEGADILVAVLPSPGGTLEAALAAGVPVIESLQIVDN